LLSNRSNFSNLNSKIPFKMVRVRFAPSPTGALHIGGVRTALYSYLFAKKMGGKMLLRIEDTDQNRFVPGAEQYIIDALNWVGITIDEGQGVGGPHAPYRQSERKEIYAKYAKQLLDEGKAYYAFDTAEELDAIRKTYESKGTSFQYNAATRVNLSNSLTLTKAEVEAKLNANEHYVIRLKVPTKEEIRLNDIVRDWVVVHSSSIDDKVLMKSDGMPTYHLANVVDDYLMEITHVIRGEEWLPSAPLHVLLYRYLGWESKMPKFAHLPLLLKPEGNGKLSKRDADLGGFPVFPLEWTDPVTGAKSIGFREEGYFSDAVVNFLAFLGWNPGSEQEIFSMDELIEAFTLERIGKAGAKFDISKANWFNHEYLKKKASTELAENLLVIAKNNQLEISKEKAIEICDLFKDRATFVKDIYRDCQFLLNTPQTYDEASIGKWTAEASSVFAVYAIELSTIQVFDADNAKNLLNSICETQGVKMGKQMAALRLAITGSLSGPDLMRSIEILGIEETKLRIENAIKALG
jgi:glutamyl-tRNA synthetase